MFGQKFFKDHGTVFPNIAWHGHFYGCADEQTENKSVFF